MPNIETNLTTTSQAIARELALPHKQVLATIELLQAGNTIPFVARYRKDFTVGLDAVTYRALEDASG